jgi:hypothetical protein
MADEPVVIVRGRGGEQSIGAGAVRVERVAAPGREDVVVAAAEQDCTVVIPLDAAGGDEGIVAAGAGVDRAITEEAVDRAGTCFGWLNYRLPLAAPEAAGDCVSFAQRGKQTITFADNREAYPNVGVQISLWN